eukprot:9276723-Lingulodinium_polyedra.AAC.1
MSFACATRRSTSCAETATGAAAPQRTTFLQSFRRSKGPTTSIACSLTTRRTSGHGAGCAARTMAM